MHQPVASQADYWKAAAIEATHSGIHWRVVCYAAGHSETAEEFDAAIQAAIHAQERLSEVIDNGPAT